MGEGLDRIFLAQTLIVLMLLALGITEERWPLNCPRAATRSVGLAPARGPGERPDHREPTRHAEPGRLLLERRRRR